jgi:4-hydroxy-tetrahydrodipicolinate reductase
VRIAALAQGTVTVAVNLIISGACGRMGTEITLLALADPSLRLVAALEAAGHTGVGSDVGSLAAGKACGVTVDDSIAGFPLDSSVCVDFTAPAALMGLLDKVESTGTRLVVGTTGLSKTETTRLERFARSHAVVFSPNMSLGVNLLFHLTDLVARTLGQDFDIEIIEAHHHFKKDAPSGTARRLGEIAAAAIGRSYDDAARNGRSGMVGERTRGEIGIHAVRGGDIVGDHTVLFAGKGERIELKHTAHSRAPLAAGTIAAAKWVADKGPGLYTTKDVLGL